MSSLYMHVYVFFFQAEDGIRDVERSRGLGDVYKRQILCRFDGEYFGFAPNAPGSTQNKFRCIEL